MMVNMAIVIPLSLDIVENVIQNQMVPTNNTSLWLGIGVLINILMTCLNSYFQLRLKKHDSVIDRQRLINNKRIDIESTIYKKLSALSYYQKNETHAMLDAIEELQTYVNDKLNSIYTYIIDYFSGVCTDFRKKDLKRETRMLKKFKRVFNE